MRNRSSLVGLALLGLLACSGDEDEGGGASGTIAGGEVDGSWYANESGGFFDLDSNCDSSD